MAASTLFVDDRGGSLGRQAVEEHIYQPLKRMNLPVELTRLEYGDFAFEGRGPEDRPLSIGIELKRLQDLATSIRNGRLAGHQLPGLTGRDSVFDAAWLVIEDHWKTNAIGEIVLYHGKRVGWRPLKGMMTASVLHKKVLTYELRGGLHVRYTNTRHDTLRFIHDLYRWWTDKSMDAHSSHVSVHRPYSYLAMSDFRETVSRFPGIGIKTSLAVEQRFHGSLREAVNATVSDWAEIETVDRSGKRRRLGSAVAARIVAFCRGAQEET